MKNSLLINCTIGLVFLLFFLTLSITFVVDSRSIYYNDLDVFNIESETKLDKDMIIDTYDKVMDYCTSKSEESLNSTSFTLSDSCIQHFKEVRSIFKICKIMLFITFVLSIVLIVYKIYEHDYYFLYHASCVTMFVPGIILFFAILEFANFFNVIRKLFLSDRFYRLDVNIDEIAKIFPNRYFQHCTILVCLFCLLCGIGMFIIYREFDKRDMIIVKNKKEIA